MARALTKTDQNGALYTRPAMVEAAIDVAFEQDLDTLGRRAWLSDSDDSEFLPLECLVHLVREARRSYDDKAMNTLMPPLLARCEMILKSTIPHNAFPNTEQIREDILGDFSLLFVKDGSDEHPNELDYYECRFHRAFRFFRIGFLRRERALLQPLDPLPPSEVGSNSNDEEAFARVPQAFRSQSTQFGKVLQKDLVRAIDNLPPDERKAVVLRHVLGLKEESDDPSAITAATLSGVTGRTVRNRLTSAAKKLSQFK